MRRKDFAIDVDTDEQTPRLTVTFDGTPETLRDRLKDDGDRPEASDLDVTYRRTGDEEPGVLGVTDRLTGEFVFEAPLPEPGLRSLVSATSSQAEGDRRYHLRIEPGDGDAFDFEKETLLVYDATGSLDREHSLIPGGVEL